ncbi:hypothetical protein IGI04_003603 [Brassica rapa subsp. trilocularis]|uniref:PHD-type domain-containing protein n=1 Tax=Brassica rapa subsp. trilocularis TaxID=1813537 RepID=A0ABQ7NZH4_BRACM|nr:hypothetical protein IGI04_003603 [Brassica rapa subsp. trilocularis]
MQALKAIILLLMDHQLPRQVAMICSSSNIHQKDKAMNEYIDPKQSRLDYDDEDAATYPCLPKKKRIWAIDPDLLSGNLFSPFDLSAEYKPSVLEKDRTLMVETSLEAEEDDDGDRENIDPLDEEEEDGIMCDICQSTDGDPSNPIVFCDGCDLMVIEEERERRCSLAACVQPKVGAMNPTKDGRWAHITCSLFVPEVYFEDPEGREGVCCSEIQSKRWEDVCVIECSEMKCELGFHVTCGLKEDLCVEYREGKKSGGIVVGFCDEHTKLWERESGTYKIVARN